MSSWVFYYLELFWKVFSLSNSLKKFLCLVSTSFWQAAAFLTEGADPTDPCRSAGGLGWERRAVFHRSWWAKWLHQCHSHLPSFASGNTAVGCKSWHLALQLISIIACSSASPGNGSVSLLTLKKPTQHGLSTFISLRIRQHQTQIIAPLCWLVFSHLVNTLWIYIPIIPAIILFPKP